MRPSTPSQANSSGHHRYRPAEHLPNERPRFLFGCGGPQPPRATLFKIDLGMPRAPLNRPPPHGRVRGSVSERWTRVLLRIGAQESASTHEIMAFCITEGTIITMESLHTITYQYAKKGLLARVATGIYKLGPKGAETVRLWTERPIKRTVRKRPQR